MRLLDANIKNRQFVCWTTVLLGLFFICIFYQYSIGILFHSWNTYGAYSHGYLTILLSAFLIFTCVKNNKLNYAGPSILSGVFLFLFSVFWLLAYFAKINTFQMLCLPFFVYLTFTYFYGFKHNSAIIVPVFILLLTIPVWGIFLPYLQRFAVEATQVILLFSSLSYRVVENQIVFQSGIFEIEESCSGLRYLLVGSLLAIVYGYLNYQSYWSTLALVLITATIMLLGNLIRIIVIIMFGIIKGMDYPLVQDHENLGWFVFAIFLLPMFIIARLIKPNIGIIQDRASDLKANATNRTSWQKWIFAFCAYLALIATAPLYANYLEKNINHHAKLSHSNLESLGGWRGPVVYRSKWAPHYHLYSHQFGAQFKKHNDNVSLNIFLYTKNDLNGELINSDNKLFNDEVWGIKDASYAQVITVGGDNLELIVNKATIDSNRLDECYRVWYWFNVNNQSYTNKLKVKLSEVIMMFKNKSGSAIISLATACAKNSDQILESYIENHYEQVNKLIDWNISS